MEDKKFSVITTVDSNASKCPVKDGQIIFVLDKSNLFSILMDSVQNINKLQHCKEI